MPKISELPDATLLAGTEWVPIEQSGVTCKAPTSAFGGSGGGGSGDGGSYTFIQGTPSSSWSVTHNLARYPSVAVIDSTGRLVEGDVQHTSTNTLVVAFSGAFSGTATCN